MQEERLWIADPKAIHHIFQGSDRLYEKPHFQRERIAMLSGWGVGTVEGDLFLIPCVICFLISTLGDTHKRQRRAMAPAFGLVEAKALYPYFTRCFNSVGHHSTSSLPFTSNLKFLSSDSSWINGTRLS